MEEQLIKFNTALLAKEKGFDGFCYDAYNAHKMQYSNGWLEYIDDNGIEIPFTFTVLKPKDILAPTQSLLQKWLREKYQIICEAQSFYDEESGLIKYESCIFSQKFKEGFTLEIEEKDIFLTYEEALEDSLQEALKDKDLWKK